ncbi:MAG: hypothetical protein E7668_00220 [Ruminococcaceae bacterium]|nr:hypothetical protein [Oscillospiraceae bacterium]
MNSSFTLLSDQLWKQTERMDRSIRQLTENNRQFLSKLPNDITLGVNYILEKDKDFLSAYCLYTKQIQQILKEADTCAAKISAIMLQADRVLQLSEVVQGDRILCAYHSFVKEVHRLLTETQWLLSEPDDKTNGSKLIRCIHDFQYQLHQFSSLLQESTIK